MLGGYYIMSKLSLSEVVKKSLQLEGSEKASMLGIGPMSKTLIKASMLLAKEKDFPLMFIASRNQVDSKELGGGYVCNWDQKGFASAIKEVANEVEFDGETISENDNPEHNMPLSDLITSLQAGNGHIIEVTESHTSPVSPPPFMAGAAEIEVDLETGKITPINYVAAVDCGTVINTNLARIQAEGGLVQGLGMTLYEDMQYTKAGKMKNRNFMSYKIPTRLDMGNIKVEFESSYEETGPFGAKSIGEIVINTPAPAIADAVYNATGLRFRTLPITAEQVLMGLLDKEEA